MNRNIKELENLIFKKKIYIILMTLIFVITGVAYSLTNVKYVASQKILIGNSSVMNTYKEIIKGSTVLEKVIQNLDLKMSVQDLSGLVEVSSVEDTNMIEIKVFGEDETAIQKISDEISNVFIATVDEIYENADLYQVDHVANYHTSGNTIVVGMVAGMAGFVLSCLFFAIGWLLDTKIKSWKDIEDITELKSLISIPKIKMIDKKKLNLKNIRAHKSEVFKLLMTNIQFVDSNHLQSKSILVTSPNSLEGKTYVAINLAIEFAKAGNKVILIDGDMRRGRIAKIFNLPNDLGFSNYLSNIDSNGNAIHERITRFINDTEIKNLNVITAGNVPPNPMELLKTEKLDELMKELKIFYDIILFDTVPLLMDPSEAIQLARKCDLNLILSAYGKTKKEDLMLAYEQLSNHARSYIGMGLNKIPETRFKKNMIALKNDIKKTFSKMIKQLKLMLRSMKNFLKRFSKLIDILKKIGVSIGRGLVILRKAIVHLMHNLKSKSQDVKEYIQKYKNKKEEIKLIEAGSIPKDEQNNIIKEVFESEMAKLESDEAEYRKKLDTLKANIETKTNELPKVRPIVEKTENQEKSKFDLIREQQKREEEINLEVPKIEEVKKEEKEVKQEPIKLQEEKQTEELEKNKKEEEKRIRKEKIENYEEIDLSKQEYITEEMIRKQVEMDDMIRLAEQEEAEEALRLRRMKKDEKIRKRKERKEKIQSFFKFITHKEDLESDDHLEEERIRKMENKIEEKIKKEKERNENKARIAKEKEEKRAFKELEKQRLKDEIRIQEELQEDNLYPKPKI